jgi:hypothetical protein
MVTSYQSKVRWIKMARHIKNELSWKPQSKKNATLGAKIIGIIKTPIAKTIPDRLIIAETAKEQEIKVEQERTKAAYFLLRRTSTTYQ